MLRWYHAPRFLESYPHVVATGGLVSTNQAPEVHMDMQANAASSAVSGNDPFLADWDRKRKAGGALDLGLLVHVLPTNPFVPIGPLATLG